MLLYVYNLKSPTRLIKNLNIINLKRVMPFNLLDQEFPMRESALSPTWFTRLF